MNTGITWDSLGILAPTAKPKVPAAAEASGAAANATGRIVETRMFKERRNATR